MSGFQQVEARRVFKRFGHTAALRGVDATFRAGEVAVLAGANGSGKTTLLGVLGTRIRPSSGQVVYGDGVEAGAARASIGWLSHETLAYPDLSGRQNIELVAAIHGLDPSAVWGRAKERFELGAFAERPVRTNSRGQRQRIALARALVHAPSLVLLDEPTTGLDGKGTERLLGVVEEERARGAVVVVVTHDEGVFAGLAAQTVRLVRGVVEEDA